MYLKENFIIESISKMKNKDLMRIVQYFELGDILRENKMKSNEMRIVYVSENE